MASSRRWADRKPCPRHPTLPGCGLRARRLPVSRSDQRASSAATPPRALEGQGQRAIRGCSIGGPLAAWPNCGPCAEYSPPKFIGGLSLTVMDGRQTLRHPSAAAWAACRRPLAVVSVSVHYTGLPPARVAVYARLTVPTRGGNRGRGHRGCIAVVVACGTRRPFTHGSWLFARVLGKRGKRGYNNWSASRLLRTLRRKG